MRIVFLEATHRPTPVQQVAWTVPPRAYPRSCGIRGDQVSAASAVIKFRRVWHMVIHTAATVDTAKFFLNRRLFARTSFLQPGMAADVSTGGGRLELANDAELKSRFAFRIAACWGDQGKTRPRGCTAKTSRLMSVPASSHDTLCAVDPGCPWGDTDSARPLGRGRRPSWRTKYRQGRSARRPPRLSSVLRRPTWLERCRKTRWRRCSCAWWTNLKPTHV